MQRAGNDIFIFQVALARRQRRNLLVLKSSSHLPVTHGGSFTMHTVPFLAEHQAGKL